MKRDPAAHQVTMCGDWWLSGYTELAMKKNGWVISSRWMTPKDQIAWSVIILFFDVVVTYYYYYYCLLILLHLNKLIIVWYVVLNVLRRVPCWTLSPGSHSYGLTSFPSGHHVILCCLVECLMIGVLLASDECSFLFWLRRISLTVRKYVPLPTLKF